MSNLPDCIKQGESARLFPIVAETSKEKRITSVFLALLPKIPDLASTLFASVGVRIGKRSKIETYTEVTLLNGGSGNDRPDGFIRVTTGNTEWCALVEAKIGRADLEEDQISRYVELARENNIDAVITISNQFVARADHHPIQLNKQKLKKTALYHWPWMWVLTKCQLLQIDEAITDQEQVFLLSEFIRFLEHTSTGVEGFTHMGKSWKEINRAVSTGESLKKTSNDVENVVASWIQEQGDLCLQLSTHVGKAIKIKMDRKVQDDPIARLKSEISDFVDNPILTVTFQVPDTASDIVVEANLLRKCVDVSMKLKAPSDKKSTKARLNWLLKMLKKDDDRIIIRALWPSRNKPTQKSLAELRENPDAIQTDNLSLSPHSFEILLVDELGGRFGGSKTFIEEIERIVPEFYGLIGQNLRSWQAPPPKPIKIQNTDNSDTLPQPVLETDGAQTVN